ncbi:MAG: hypothetical protein J6Y84_06385, partial [Bacteroidaceae bacterium]|nr:hypothetical protein [Bacteroidaceae bacterium]
PLAGEGTKNRRFVSLPAATLSSVLKREEKAAALVLLLYENPFKELAPQKGQKNIASPKFRGNPCLSFEKRDKGTATFFIHQTF